MRRPSWDQYFMLMAWVAAMRSVCERRHVGAVIVKGNRVVSTGYNGTVSGLDNCPGRKVCTHGVGHGCGYTQHAEMNALSYGNFTDMKGGTLYTTLAPCPDCFVAVANAGIKRIVYDSIKESNKLPSYYYGKSFFDLCEELGIEAVKVTPSWANIQNFADHINGGGAPDGYDDPLEVDVED